LSSLYDKHKNRLESMRRRCMWVKILTIVLTILTSWFNTMLLTWFHWWLVIPLFLISLCCILYTYLKLWPDALLKEQVDILMGKK